MGFISLIIVAVENNTMSLVALIGKEDIIICFQSLSISALESLSNGHELNALGLRHITKSQ